MSLNPSRATPSLVLSGRSLPTPTASPAAVNGSPHERRRILKSAGLPQSLIDQLPATRRERPTVVSTSGRIEQRLTVTPLRQVPRTDEAVDGQIVPSRTRAKVRQNYGEKIWFVLSVVLPVAIAAVYFAFFASNQYVAEFRFAVKDATMQSTSAATSSIISMIGGSGGSLSYDNYLVTDYLLSRQATEELQQRINVTQLYARPEADWWARFDPSQPMEKFVKLLAEHGDSALRPGNRHSDRTRFAPSRRKMRS